MPKININNILRGMTVTSFGMGAFNLFNNIQNRNWQTRVDALIADRESLSAKISVLQEVKIESLEHKITVEEQINKVLIALNENNKSLTSLKDYALANPSTLNPEIVNAKIEQAEKSGKMVNETANNLFNNLKSSIGDEWFNSILKSIQEWFNTLGFGQGTRSSSSICACAHRSVNGTYSPIPWRHVRVRSGRGIHSYYEGPRGSLCSMVWGCWEVLWWS